MPQEGKALKTIQIPGQQQLAKFVPKAHGVAQNSLTGVGFGRIARRLDTVVLKGTLQNVGITIPFIKIRADIIDVFNFAIHNGSISKLKKEGFIAVGADKIVDAGFNIPNFAVPRDFNNVIAQANLEAEL